MAESRDPAPRCRDPWRRANRPTSVPASASSLPPVRGGHVVQRPLVYIHVRRQAYLFAVVFALRALAFSLAAARAGSSMAARMAMIAITTSSSINVNALRVQVPGAG